MTCCDCYLKMFGGLALTYVLLQLFKLYQRLVHPFFFAKTPDIHELAGAKYAVVTGSTDGIGKAYATQLAQKGFNIVLVSRSEEKLAAVKQEISELVSGVEVQTIAFDFTNASVKDYESKLFEKLKAYEIGVLVNNVGMAHDYPEVLHNTHGDIQKVRDVAVVNTVPVTILTQEILKQMVERRRGVVINIGSIAGSSHLKGWSVYSATKRYISHLSGILAKEYEPLGITIQNITPGLVTTNMSGVTDISFAAPNPKTFVESALKTVGVVQETAGFIVHQAQLELIQMLPVAVLDYIIKGENAKIKSKYLGSVKSASK
uniref:Estradiol 17-beta-dehydrogenase 12 n=1 Tax=Rhabditophanes sp. KR3021 TaxID=114890 RepID=A0AC35UFL5_9BILA